MLYFDWTWIVLVLPAMLISMWASSTVKNTYRKYQTHLSSRGLTGAQAARAVLDANGLHHIRIEPTHGELTDHFDPTRGVICLSEGVFAGRSTAAIGIACHEVGHAIQHAVDYAPVRLRMAIIPITNIGSKLSMPLIFIGIALSSVSYVFSYLAYAGIACFALLALFQLITLPTEFNASARALSAIAEHRLLSDGETLEVKQVLRAAALTYVAALAVALMQLIRLILIVNRRSDRR